jgi:two-component system sensor histidine kinase DcuS
LPPDSNIIQPVALTVMQRNNLLFAVVTDMHGRRYSHPNGALLGKAFIGDDLRPALEDKENVAINHGVLGEALRVFTPVYNAQRQQIGVVAVGISLDKVEQQIARNRWDAIWLVLFSALLGALGAWGLVRMLKRVLFGLEPYQISALLEQRQAMLQSLREGVIAVDQQGHVTIINHAARQILNTSTSGHALHETPLLANLREVLQTAAASGSGDQLPRSAIALQHPARQK